MFDSAGFQHWLFRWEGTRFFILRRKIPGGDLAGFHVWLVQSINSKNRTRNRGGNLPAKKFRAQVVYVGHGDAHDWMPGLFERRYFCVDCNITSVLSVNVSEQAIAAVYFRSGKLLAFHRKDALSKFSRRLRQQLLDPRAPP